MDFKTFIIAVFIAVSYVGWPNLAKPLDIKPGIVPFMIIIVALIVVVTMSHKDLVEIPNMGIKPLLIVLAFAVANGLAIYLYADKAADKNIQTGIFLGTIFVLQVCFAFVVDWLINGNKPSTQQMVGFILSIPAMWLMIQKPQ